jgi:hypothetical protein
MARRDYQPLLWCRIPVTDRSPIPVYLTSPDLHPFLDQCPPGSRYADAYTDRDAWEILIFAGSPMADMLDALLHEHQHAALTPDRPLCARTEERAVEAITPAILPGLKALGWNPPALPDGWRSLAAHARWVRFGKRQRAKRKD